jgi:hypothetical protein
MQYDLALTSALTGEPGSTRYRKINTLNAGKLIKDAFTATRPSSLAPTPNLIKNQLNIYRRTFFGQNPQVYFIILI